MEYEEIWKKVLGPKEEIKYEFSVSKTYRKAGMILCVIAGVFMTFIFLPLAIVAIVIVLFGFFYFGQYLKKANAYAFTNKRVLVHKGVLSTRLISIDYEKITDVTIQEPFLSFGMAGKLIINTAGTGLHEVILEHIENPYEIKKKLDVIRESQK